MTKTHGFRFAGNFHPNRTAKTFPGICHRRSSLVWAMLRRYFGNWQLSPFARQVDRNHRLLAQTAMPQQPVMSVGVEQTSRTLIPCPLQDELSNQHSPDIAELIAIGDRLDALRR